MKSTEQQIPITEEDLERFQRNAPAALARRGAARWWEESLAGLQTVVFGALPIVGLWWWGWSAAQMLLFLLVGAWAGILCDAAKVLLLRQRAEAFAAAVYDDWHVWVVAAALRDGSHKAPESHLRAKWNPLGGVFIDFAMGGVSTVVIVVQLMHDDLFNAELLQTQGVVSGMVGLTLVRLLSTAWEIVHHRANALARGQWRGGPDVNPDGDRPVKAAVGLRGVGLFMLMVVIAVLSESPDGPHPNLALGMILSINALAVAGGLLTISTPLWLAGETRWLREYLAGREQAC